MTKCKTGILAAALMVLGLATTSAAAVTLTYQNPSNIFNGNGYKDLTLVKSDAPAPATTTPRAGGFSLKAGVSEFVAWCLDLTHFVGSGNNYNITTTPFSLTTGLIDPVRLGNIMEHFKVNYSTFALTDPNKSGGFQLALWELLYENSGVLDADDGTFKATAGGGAITEANVFLAALGKGAPGQSYKFTFYESVGGAKQNLVSVAAVPLPAAALLLGSGLLGLFAMKLRRLAFSTAG